MVEISMSAEKDLGLDSSHVLGKDLGLDSSTRHEKKKMSRVSKKRLQQQIQADYLSVYFPQRNYDTLEDESKTKFGYKILSSTKSDNDAPPDFMQPKNPHQKQYVALLNDPNKKIIVVSGPAGTGKTLFATEYGIRHMQSNLYEKLIFTRPSVSVDENLGFLPGNMEEKMAPWIRPIYDILYQHYSPTEVDEMIAQKTIEIAPLGFMRGRTFKNSWIVADEMQNSTVGQMKMLLTRLGENSRLVVTGDLEQHDRPGEINGLEDFLTKFRGSRQRSESISSVEFQTEDVQREPVVKEVLDLYSAAFIPYYEDQDIQ